MNTTVTTRLCFDLKIIDARPHHPCYTWNHTATQCEIDWPCEVRQYLVSISPFIHLTQLFLSYGSLLIILLGLFLNLLSLYTLVSSGLSKSGSGIYLVSLAICDCGNLLFNYATGLARGHFPVINDLFMSSEWLCRWHGVFVDLFQLISAWIVVAFSIERCLAIWYPMVLRSASRTGRARKTITWLASILTLFSLSKLMLTGFEKDSVFGYPGCYSGRYRWRGLSYVRVAFQTWIPTILVFTFNLLMFCKLRQLKKVRKRLTEIKRQENSYARRQGSFINRPSPTAPMLVAVSLAYLVLVFPVGVAQTVELIWSVENPQPRYSLGDWEGREAFIKWKKTKLLLKYIRSFCFGFYQINFCVNFFLYFAAGLQFRVHLQNKVKFFWKRWCCGGRGGGEGEPATPGTSSTALDSRRGSQRFRRSQSGYHRESVQAPPVVGRGCGGFLEGEGVTTVVDVEVMISSYGNGREGEENTQGIVMEALNLVHPSNPEEEEGEELNNNETENNLLV